MNFTPDTVKMNNRPSLIEISEILERGDDFINDLELNTLHELYRLTRPGHALNINYLKSFRRWELEVSKRIAQHFWGVSQILPETIMRFNEELDWELRNENHDQQNEDLQKIFEIHDYFKQTSHTWIVERKSINNAKFEECYTILQNIGFSNEYLEELTTVFPSFLLTENKYISRSKFVMRHYEEEGMDSIINLLTISNKKGLIKGSENFAFPFINLKKLVLFFWLEQETPLLSPKMILSKLLGNINVEPNGWDVFLTWLWKRQLIVKKEKNRKEEIHIQEQILKMLSILGEYRKENKHYSPQVRLGWKPFADDARAAKDRLLILKEKLEKLRNGSESYKSLKLKPSYTYPSPKQLKIVL